MKVSDASRQLTVLLLGSADSIHIFRWAEALSAEGIDVHVASVHPTSRTYSPDISLHIQKVKAPYGYINPWPIRKLIKRIQPDIVHAHYATGYGLLGVLTRFHPLIVSMWGSDVLLFPNKSPFHRAFLKRVLEAADTVCSTSMCMQRAALELSPDLTVELTPFGVDHDIFQFSEQNVDNEVITIGTVKGLAAVYGIDTLIRAFALAVERVGSHVDLRLAIYGDGGDRAALEALATQCGLGTKVTFHGRVEHAAVPEILNSIDIFVALSNSESFGVSVIEASSTGRPVIVSDADGLMEVVQPEETALVVPRNDAKAASDAMLRLINDPKLRIDMGKKGRRFVGERFSWNKSVETMIAVYKSSVKT